MTGRAVMIGFLAFTAVFAVALWWFQTRAFYERTQQQTVAVAGETYAVSDWQGIDATSSPLKLRACFRLAPEAVAEIAGELPPYDGATPLVAPAWFDCFDAGALTRALAEGRATAWIAAAEDRPGADRVLAAYPDGRAYLWRQLTPEFAEQ